MMVDTDKFMAALQEGIGQGELYYLRAITCYNVGLAYTNNYISN